MSGDEPSVAFHTGVADAVVHALRLTRKAWALGSRVLVIGPSEWVRELDEQLWTAEPGSFLPHVLWEAAAQPAAASSTRLHRAPIWLWGLQQPGAGDAIEVPTDRDVLINLGLPVPRNAGQYGKVIEVVSAEPAHRGPGQQRWRTWRDRGVSPAHHAFS